MHRKLRLSLLKIWRNLNANLLMVSLTFVVVVSVLVYQYLYNEQELDQRLAVVKQIDQADADFSNGLMHLALSGDETSPWQYTLGLTLIRQSLNEYKDAAKRLVNVNNNQEFITAINKLSDTLNEISNEETILDLDLRQRVFVMRKQANILERQLAAEIEQQRINQSSWVIASTLIGSVIICAFAIALTRSRNRRSLLNKTLKLSEQRFFKMLQNTDEVFWLESFSSQELAYVSPAFKKIAHVDAEDVLYKTAAWKKLVHVDDHKFIIRARRNALFEAQDIEFRVLQERGRVIWISGRIFPIWADDEQSQNTKPEYIAAVLRDITQKREYENNLVQTQKMDSLGQLTGGVAHDFNNLLTVILSNTQLLLPHLKGVPELEYTANMISRAAQRGASLNQQLLAFASKQELHPETVLLNALVEDSVNLLSRTIGERYLIDLQNSTQQLWVKVDPGQLQNTLVNLCINSRDAMPNGGKISIRVHASLDETLDGSESIKIMVKDNGCGIASNIINRVFDPFFSTKDASKGTGLGLSMVYGFVRQSGGRIRVDSKLNKGTSFHILLPSKQKVSRLKICRHTKIR